MTKKQKQCNECGKPNAYLGAVSGTCPACQNKSVEGLEQELGLKKGELGRVNAKGEEL
jgi:hypothetical protein